MLTVHINIHRGMVCLLLAVLCVAMLVASTLATNAYKRSISAALDGDGDKASSLAELSEFWQRWHRVYASLTVAVMALLVVSC